MTRHLLTIIFPSGLTVIIVQTCPGEEPRARPDATSWARLPPRPGREPPAGRIGVGARRGCGAGGLAARVSRPQHQGRGTERLAEGGGGRRRAARAPGRPSLRLLPPASHSGAGRRRPQPAGRASAARARWLGGTAPRRADGLPAAGARIPGPAPPRRLASAPGPRPGPPRLRAAPISGPAPRRAHGAWRARPSPARPLCCPRSGVRVRPGGAMRGGAALFPRRRRPWSGLRASSARRRHLAAAAQLRALPGRCGAGDRLPDTARPAGGVPAPLPGHAAS